MATTLQFPSRPRSKCPSEFPRRILLITTGLSPQVVTESLYALAVCATPRFIPTEIRLITTKDGAERIRTSLLQGKNWFNRLCSDYYLSGIRFEPESIHTLVGADDQPLDDIRTPIDNQLAADQISNYVRELTTDANAAIHASMAGGRKSMGLFLGYALSFYARPQDRLSHVLVSSPFESNPNFFYPPPTDHFIKSNLRDNRPINSRHAKVTLAQIPFVRLRNEIPTHILDSFFDFEKVVSIAQQSIGPAELIIDLNGRKILAAGIIIPVLPSQISFLAWIARIQKEGKPWVRCPTDELPEKDYANSFLEQYQQSIGEMRYYYRTKKRLQRGMTRNFFSQTKSKLNNLLKENLPQESVYPYLIKRKKDGRVWRHGLELAPEFIHFETID